MQLPGRNQSDGTAGSPGNPTGRLRIEAENYSGQQDVEREACGGLGGTLNIGYIDVGNFITYDVTAPVSGTYTINFRLANGGPAAAFQLRDSLTQTVLATINVPYTGGWQSYLTLSATATLPAGQQILQLLCTANNWNLNWLELLPPGTGSGGYNGNGAYHIEAEDFISQNGTLLENCLDAGATYNIGSINEGDWLDYRINMPVGGNYQFSIRAASGNGSNSVQLRTQNGTVLATLNVGNTGGYQTFATFTGNVILPAGVQTLRLQVTGGYMAVNWLELSAPPGAPPLDNYALIVRDNPYNTGGGLMYEAENTFTVEFWVKPSGEHEIDGESPYGTGGTSGQKYVMYPTNGGDGYGSRAGMGVSVGTNGVSVYEHADNYMPAVLVWQRPTDTAWMHVAVVYRNGKPSLYINGEWKRDGVQSSRQHVYPGTQFPGGFYGSQTNGQVDEIRIWSVARTQQQLAANMNGELSTASNNTGLQGYWPMNEGAGAVLHDVSGSGRHIDLTSAGYSGASWTNGSYSVTTTAASSYRYGFNGQEHATEIGDDDYTAQFWEYDSRIGRRWNVDPKFKKYPDESPYLVFHNSPISINDPNGDEAPKNFKKYSGAGGDLYLPADARVEVYKGGKGETQNTKTKISAKKGDVRAFNIGDKRFVASYDKKGKFSGYNNFVTGEGYKTPDIEIKAGMLSQIMDLNFVLTNTGNSSSAQAIQIVETNQFILGPTFRFTENGQRFSGFVDGGINSKSAQRGDLVGQEVNPGTPYYINSNIVSVTGKPVGQTGYINKLDDKINLNIFDDPRVRNRSQAIINFQTIIVSTNFYGSGQNVVMGVYNWGFSNSSGTPIQTHTSNKVDFTTTSQRSLNILNNDYPTYKLSQ